jgi:hypothetical protein
MRPVFSCGDIFSTELIPTIFFGPMSILQATEGGEEFYYAIAYASPLFLLIPKVRETLLTETTWIYLTTLSGIPSYSANSYHMRSLLLMTGCGFGKCIFFLLVSHELGILVHFSQLWRPLRRERVTLCLLMGLFVLISSRFMFSTLYVVWMSRTLNWLFFTLGIVACNVLGTDPELQYEV